MGTIEDGHSKTPMEMRKELQSDLKTKEMNQTTLSPRHGKNLRSIKPHNIFRPPKIDL